MSEATVTVCIQVADYLSDATCDETTHYFDKVPGRCRCKREVWEPEPPRLRVVK